LLLALIAVIGIGTSTAPLHSRRTKQAFVSIEVIGRLTFCAFLPTATQPTSGHQRGASYA